MSEMQIHCRCAEALVGSSHRILREYEQHLPHGKFVEEAFCKSFNDAEGIFLECINEELGGVVTAVYAKPFRAGRNTVISITVAIKKGIRFTHAMKGKAYAFVAAQLDDGWGEGFFRQEMTAPDGAVICVYRIR